MLIVNSLLNEKGIFPTNYNYPDRYKKYYGRRIFKAKLSELKEEMFPLFVKPLEEKTAPGIVFNSHKYFNTEYDNIKPDSELLCSEVVNFLSEWRCFIRYNRIEYIRFYRGNSNIQPDYSIVEEVLGVSKDMPAAYTLDFGITEDGRTLIVEMNDGYSIGCYGLDEIKYAKFLTARWTDMHDTSDPFKD